MGEISMKINNTLSPAYNDTEKKTKRHQADEYYVTNSCKHGIIFAVPIINYIRGSFNM